MFEDLIPRKYNNPVTIGLFVVVVVAVIFIVWMMWGKKTPNPEPPQRQTGPQKPPPQQQRQPPPAAPPKKETYVGSGQPAIVLFWADWCGHSKNMKKDWDTAAETLKKSGEFDVLEFEHKQNPAEVADAQKLPEFKGFPDIRYYPQGYPTTTGVLKYSGNRTSDSIIKFAYSAGTQT